MTGLDLIQGTDEWRQARVGSLGASCVADVVAKTKTGYGASRANRMAAMIIERLTGDEQDYYQNAAMLHGINTEPEARLAYEFMRGVEVAQVGLVKHPRIEGTHASPDGLIGDDGVLEIKCPQSAAHIEVLLTGRIPEKYATQMMWQLACTGRKWADFVSYSPRFPEEMRLFVKRLPRVDARIEELEKEVSLFLAELAGKVSELRQLYSMAEAA
jgi:putative phage-type endonuclease